MGMSEDPQEGISSDNQKSQSMDVRDYEGKCFEIGGAIVIFEVGLNGEEFESWMRVRVSWTSTKFKKVHSEKCETFPSSFGIRESSLSHLHCRSLRQNSSG